MARSYIAARLFEHPPPQNIPPGAMFYLRRFWRGAYRAEHEELFIQMNEARHFASGWVQRGTRKVAPMIDEPGHPTGHLVGPFEGGDDHV